VSPVTHELGFYIPEDAILHSHLRENLKSYTELNIFTEHDFRDVFQMAEALGMLHTR
jgi:hypothetical protein